MMTKSNPTTMMTMLLVVTVLYVCLAASQPAAFDQDYTIPAEASSEEDSSLDVSGQGSWKEKRPFCNAFAGLKKILSGARRKRGMFKDDCALDSGCGRKRSSREMKRLASESLLMNYPRNADLKLWDRLYAKLQNRYRSSIKD